MQNLGNPMRTMRPIMLLSFLFLFASSNLYAASAQELITRADSLCDIDDYRGAEKLYRDAIAADSANFGLFWKLGKCLNFMGELAPKDSQLVIFEKARDAELTALNLNDASADAHFQLARAVGKIALYKGIFNSIGLAKQVKREADRALALDSLHDGAWHILGRWHREVSKKPKIFRGPMGLGDANKTDAVAFMQKAVAINPGLIHHHLEMGITYLDYDRDTEARQEFEKCLSLPAERPLEVKYQDEAKKYLAGMDKK
jgi:tetratricopeptide (TPR) repeat protein